MTASDVVLTPPVGQQRTLPGVGAPPRRGAGSLLRSDRVVVAGLTVLAFGLRVPTIGRAYWVDEGISIGIASHPLRRIPGLLRLDGSPPLFYVVLHFWIRAFGSSEVATHSLPLLVSLVAVPVGYWGGRSLAGRGAGLAAAALFATNPFLNWYSTETRMYPIAVVLGLVALTASVRGVRDRSRWAAAGAVVAFAALLYTHDWGIYLFAVTATTLFVGAVRRRDRRIAGRIAAGAAAVVVLWLPWVPTFVEQARTTAAPWAVPPGVGDAFADPATALGGTIGALVVPVAVLAAWWTRRRRPLADGSTAAMLTVIGVATCALGWIAAQIEPSWTVRYLAVVVAPFLLAAAVALTATRLGRVAVVVVCSLLAGWSVIGSLLPNPNAAYAKSNVGAIARAAAPQLAPGDVVVVTQTEQVPVLEHYLPGGLIYVTPTGVVEDPTVVDWRNIVHRLEQARPCSAVAPWIDMLPVGAHVLEVNPVRRLGATGSAWSRAVNSQVVAVDKMIAGDPGLEPIGSYALALVPQPYAPVVAELFRKTAGIGPCE